MKMETVQAPVADESGLFQSQYECRWALANTSGLSKNVAPPGAVSRKP